MNPQSFAEAKQLFDATKKIAEKYKKAEVIIAPPIIFLPELARGYRGSLVELCAQDISQEAQGAFTGEVSAAQVRDAGASCVLIGHAERRLRGETDEIVNQKILQSLKEKLSIIIAVGESQRDEHGEYIMYIREQIVTALSDVPLAQFKNITIAYEPLWAIGAPVAPDAHEVHQMMLLVRKIVAENFGTKALKGLRVVYGGAVNESNAQDILSIPDVHGVLVGRASLDNEQLRRIVEAAHTA